MNSKLYLEICSTYYSTPLGCMQPCYQGPLLRENSGNEVLGCMHWAKKKNWKKWIAMLKTDKKYHLCENKSNPCEVYHKGFNTISFSKPYWQSTWKSPTVIILTHNPAKNILTPGLSKVAGWRQKLLPTWLVLAGYSAWHFFTDGVF